MASANYDISLKVKLEDVEESPRVKVTTVYTDPQTKKDHEHCSLIPAPPKPGRITQAVGESIRLFLDRGFGLVDASEFKSQYKKEDTTPGAVEMADAEKGKAPVIANPNKPAPDKKDDAKKADTPAKK